MNPIFIDIDGTLTEWPEKAMGPVVKERIDKVKQMIRQGIPVVIWSATGTEYAKKFCERNGLQPVAAIGKPHYCVDDCPTVRPHWTVKPDTWLDQNEQT